MKNAASSLAVSPSIARARAARSVRSDPGSLLSTRPVGVELLILRILRGGFAGTLVTGALGAGGCETGNDDPGARTRQDPSVDGRTDASATDASSPNDAGLAPICTASTPDELHAAGFTTAEPFDYVAVREINQSIAQVGVDGGPESWTRDGFKVVTETGRTCATANSGSCAEKVAHHPLQFVHSYSVGVRVERSVVTTHGDEVKRWATDAELQTLFGVVDTRDEALFFALRAGYWAGCTSREADGLHVEATHYKTTCPILYERVTMRVSDTGELEVLDAVALPGGGCVGRVPAGLCSVSEARHESAVGDYLAHAAHLEDASVYAFERLARELTAYGAPREMVAASLHAADDEVRHARVIGALASARGGKPVPAAVQELALRTLEEIATENATEGCVRETYGALVGGYQARQAGDLGVRSAMREVAADEARHAALSLRVHAWAMSRLDVDARERVLVASQRAIAELTRECRREVDEGLRAPLGLPDSTVAQALLRELSLSLWQDSDAVAVSPRNSEPSARVPLRSPLDVHQHHHVHRDKALGSN